MNFEVSKYPCGSDPARDVETALHRAHMPTSHCGLGGGSLRTSSGHFDLFVYGGGTEEVARTTLAASQMNPLTHQMDEPILVKCGRSFSVLNESACHCGRSSLRIMEVLVICMDVVGATPLVLFDGGPFVP